jgi:hypothetical protein
VDLVAFVPNIFSSAKFGNVSGSILKKSITVSMTFETGFSVQQKCCGMLSEKKYVAYQLVSFLFVIFI